MAGGDDGGGGAFRDLAAALKRARPVGLVAVNESGDDVQVALVGSRLKWEKAAKTVLAMNATAVKCLDVEGRVTEVIAIETAEETRRTLPASARSDEVAHLVQIALDAQDRAQQRTLDLVRDTMQTNLDMMRATADRADKLERILERMAEEREANIAATRAQLQALPKEERDQMGDALMQMLMMRLGMPTPTKQ